MVSYLERRSDAVPLQALLDRSVAALDAAGSAQARVRAVAALMADLTRVSASASPGAWRALANLAADHPAGPLLREDPLVCRSYERRPGAAGDALVVDALCRREGLQPSTPIGLAVRAVLLQRPLALALRHRSEWLARQIDRAADRGRGGGRRSRVLAVGSGLLHEARMGLAVRAGAVGELIAVDGDGDSLARVARDPLPGIRTLQLPPRSLLRDRTWAWRERLGTFDLVYATSAYSELDGPCARRLTRRLFNLLAPGGRLAFCDFSPALPDAASMETFMAWPCSGRDLATMADLSVRIRDDEVGARRVFRGPYSTFSYGTVDRAEAPGPRHQG